MKIVAEDAALALKIWVWCVQEFGPYQKYMRNDWSLYNSIIFYAGDYPEEFLPLAIRELGTNTDFCRDVLTNSKQFPCGIAKFISKALELDLIAEAQMIFNAVVMNPVAKDKEIEDVIYGIISDCSTWKELENMEKFKFSFLPHIKRMNNKYIQQLYPKFLEQVDQYISIVESSRKKYRYSRKYAWRTTCEDGSEYGLNPLNYETVEEYNEALKKKRAKDREARRIPNLQDDPLATTDKTIYTFCSVVFPSSHQPYTYLTGEIEVKIGDTVVVPVGSKDKKAIATVVSISQHMRMTAPYPVEKTKKIIKKVEPTDSEKRLFDA